eukprot:3905624-Alexandrium_andersonii.AAC.1
MTGSEATAAREAKPRYGAEDGGAAGGEQPVPCCATDCWCAMLGRARGSRRQQTGPPPLRAPLRRVGEESPKTNQRRKLRARCNAAASPRRR